MSNMDTERPGYCAIITECCGMAIGPDCRFCPKCGHEARVERKNFTAQATAPAEIEVHPVQRPHSLAREQSVVPKVVALRAYEVYSEVFGPQPALIDKEGRGCRGGFGVNELIAFLYAHSFPKSEWRSRIDEAFKGMKHL